MMDQAEIYYQLYRIRRFEETVLDNFSSGVFFGTTHTYMDKKPTPSAYSATSRKMILLLATTAATGIFWPMVVRRAPYSQS